MTALPEALRLADEIESLRADAAAELRRLHAENEALRVDAERMDWLSLHCREVWVRPETLHSDFPDARLRWELPHLQSYNCIGAKFTLREAIDIEIEHDADAAINAARSKI